MRCVPSITTILGRNDVYAETICDGIHVHPVLIRAILITDGMSAIGMPDGTYTLGALLLRLKDGVCLSQGTLAGRSLTMDHAVANSRVCRCLAWRRGPPIAPGLPANFNLYDEKCHLSGSLLEKQLIRS
jgi:N-acetylglucosamine-6-phosphate deacetylase